MKTWIKFAFSTETFLGQMIPGWRVTNQHCRTRVTDKFALLHCCDKSRCPNHCNGKFVSSDDVKNQQGIGFMNGSELSAVALDLFVFQLFCLDDNHDDPGLFLIIQSWKVDWLECDEPRSSDNGCQKRFLFLTPGETKAEMKRRQNCNVRNWKVFPVFVLTLLLIKRDALRENFLFLLLRTSQACFKLLCNGKLQEIIKF